VSDTLTYHFGTFSLVPAQRVLRNQGQPVKLGARALDMLVTLVECRSRTVGKKELLARVWAGLVVEDNNLQVQILTLRKLLGHPAIATIPGRGYRFVLPVSTEGEDVAAPPPSPPAALPAGPVLIGRDADLAELISLMDRHPLVSIVGAGGIGKTHLARAAARASAAAPPCWVELAPLSDPAAIASTVGRALGFAVDGANDAVASVADALRERSALLVLDNAEHLLEGVVGFIEAARERAPGLRIVVTSQEVLRAKDEQVYRASPLSLPASDALSDVAASGAGALFAARVSAVDPGFRLGAANAAAVADICRRLDGIPLALELAAGRTPLLGVEGLRARLNERFNVLTAGARVALRRHQTLRAALEWSHSLLSPPEQAVFRRLGAFVGGFALEAAQMVCDDDQIDSWDVLEHLGSLTDKSVVLAEGEGIPRYRMLETTRLFALERLADAGETAATLERHARAMSELLGAGRSLEQHWLATPAQFDADVAEVDNARAAIDWAARCNSAELALSVAAHTSVAFMRADIVNEYLDRVLPLRRHISDALPVDLVGLFWLKLAMAGAKGASAESAAAARHAVDVFRRIGDTGNLYQALACAVLIGANRDDCSPLQAMVDEAIALERPGFPPALRSYLRWARYRALRREGREEEALQCALEQVELSAQRDPVFTHRISGVNVVDCEIALGRFAQAEAHARTALDALAAAGVDDRRTGPVLEGLALALVLQDRPDEAVAVARRARPLLAADGDDLRLLETLALAVTLQARAETAARILGHVDDHFARRGWLRWPAASERRARLDTLIAEALPLDRLRALTDTGRAMGRSRLYELALAAGASGGVSTASLTPD
jgi:predicted ATPase/DNA-binding winged helix-turn-helix (wHTH) protein